MLKSLICSQDNYFYPQFSSVAQSCPTLCDPMDCSMPGLPVHRQLPEFTQTHVHRVSDAIQPSHPLLSPSPAAFNLSQHQGLFKWVFAAGGQSIGVSASASVLPMTIQGWSYRMDWVDLLAVQRTLKHLLHTTVLPSGTFWFMRIINIPYLALSLLSTTLGLEILSLEIVLPPILTKKNFFFFFFYPSLGIPATAIQFFRHFTSVVRFGKKFSRIRVSPGRKRAFSRA